MNKKTLLLFLNIFLFQFLSINAQNTIPFKHYNYENGLISNWINSITQDRDDFIWIGTADGLCRFNGYSFDNYKNTSSDSSTFADNFISSIAVDSIRNCLWLVTSTGISKFDKTSYKFKNYGTFTTTNTAYSPFARGSVCVDSQGNVWVEGFNEGFSDGLFKYMPQEDKFINISKINKSVPNNLTAICEDQNHRLWLGSEKGLYYYLPETDSYKQIKYSLKNGDPLHITSLYIDSKNILWIGSKQSNSIYICTNDSISKYYEPVMETTEYNWISTITSYNNDIILAGIKDLGVMVLNQSTGESDFLQPDLYNPKGLQSKTPNVMYTDKFGNVWIGSYNNGLNFIDKNRKLFEHYHFNYTSTGLMSNSVRALFEDSDGEIWIGTKEGGGISKFKSKEGVFENYKADKSKANWIDNDIIISINELEPGKLLVGTFGSGIFTYHKKENIFSQFSKADTTSNSISNNNIYSIYKDFDGIIWIGNNSFTDIYNPTTKQYSHLKNVTYARCFLDIGKNILIGTWSNGVYKYNKSTKTTENYELSDPKLILDKKTRINSMAQDLDGTLWFATNKGLVKHKTEPSNTRVFTKKDGLINDNICAVLVDDRNNVWVSTKGGISKLTTKGDSFKNYDKHDGLQSNVFEEFVSLKTSDGSLLFAGSNGFNIFQPDSIKDNPNIPNVVITEMLVLNKPIEIGEINSPLKKHISLTKELELTHEQSSFSFEFIGINYTSPENNQYKYKLEGFDNDWKYAEHSRIATYTHIQAGNYTFKVIASNNDGLWNNEGASVRIKVLPPFWKSNTAIVIYFVLLILLLTLFAAIVTYRTNHEHKLKAEILEKQRIDEAGKNRLRFFTNISHELRTPLTLITSPLEKLTHYDTKDPKLKSNLMSMNRNAQRLLRLVNQLMDFRRIEENRIILKVAQGDIIKESKDIFNSFEDIAQTKKLSLIFTDYKQDTAICWFDFGILEKVLFNLISNAIKFTPKGGKIELSVRTENDKAIIKVKDNGVGIASDSLDKVFDRFYTTDIVNHHQTGAGIGLSFTKSLVTLHRGDIKVESEVDKGSCFSFIIPIDKDSFKTEEISTNSYTSPDLADEPTIPQSIQFEDMQTELIRKKETVMIVEDHDDLREYLMSNFEEYTLIECMDGEMALEKAKEHMPDIILSDIMMPKMNGLELCNSIKTSFITSHIPVILLTARTSDDQKIEGFRHHADAYIEKPFNIDLLKIQVENILQLRENIKEKYKNNAETNNIDPIEETCDIPPLDKLFLDKVSELITLKISDFDFSVEGLSSELGMSRSQLFRKFKALLNTTPSKYIRDTRLKHAAELLIKQHYNVNEVTFMVGFSDVSHFISLFKNQFGQTPKQFSESHLKKE